MTSNLPNTTKAIINPLHSNYVFRRSFAIAICV